MESSRVFNWSGLFRALVFGWITMSASLTAAAKTLGDFLIELGYHPVKMEINNNHWAIDAQFNGKKRRCHVDTGCTFTVVDKATARKLPRWKDPGTGASTNQAPDSERTELVLVKEIEVGGLSFNDVVCGVAEFSDPNAGYVPTGSHIAIKRTIDAILGKEWLERTHALLHISGRTLYLRTNAPTAEQARLLARTLTASGMTNAPLRDIGPAAWGVRIRMNGNPTTLILDTGTFATQVDADSAKAWGIEGEHTQIQTYGVNHDLRSEIRITTVDVMELGACRFEKFPIGVGSLRVWNLGARSTSPLQIDGVLGNDALNRANAIFDCSAGALWVVPGTATK
jgi:predicted aspartyl protease